MLEITAFWYGKPNLLCPVRELCCIGRLLQPLISYREMQATNIVSTQVPLINFHRLPTYLPTHPPTYLPLHYNGSQEFFKKSHKKDNKDAKRFFRENSLSSSSFHSQPFYSTSPMRAAMSMPATGLTFERTQLELAEIEPNG